VIPNALPESATDGESDSQKKNPVEKDIEM